MAIDQATVRKIASLARIAISDAEAAAMEGELNGILGWVEQLGEVDVTGVEPMTAVIPNRLRLREDVVDADPLTGRNWYLENEIPLVGGASHPLDLLRWISGKEVRRVMGISNHVAFPAMTHDDCQVCLFEFEDGTIAKVAALYAPRCAVPPYNNLRIYGTNGTIERDTGHEL